MADPDDVDRESDQLEPEDTLDYRGVDDVLDEGYSPPERPWTGSEFGTTAREAATGEDLDDRLARELPDDFGDEDDEGDGIGDSADSDGELYDDEVGSARSGRLVDADEGGYSDTDDELTAEDLGVDGAGASAEEAAMHIVRADD